MILTKGHQNLLGVSVLSYQRNHVHHGSITGYEKQKGDLYSVRLVNVSGLHLIDNQFADEVVLWFLDPLID